MIRDHRGKEAAELLYAGERLWSLPAIDEPTKELQKEIEKSSESLSHPQTTAAGPQQPIKLQVGKHALLAYVQAPDFNEQKPPPLLSLKNGDNQSEIPFLIFARVGGKMIVWEKPSGFSLTPSGGSEK